MDLRILLEAHGLLLAISAGVPHHYPILMRKYREATGLTDLDTGRPATDSYVTEVDPATVGTVAQQQRRLQHYYRQHPAS